MFERIGKCLRRTGPGEGYIRGFDPRATARNFIMSPKYGASQLWRIASVSPKMAADVLIEAVDLGHRNNRGSEALSLVVPGMLRGENDMAASEVISQMAKSARYCTMELIAAASRQLTNIDVRRAYPLIQRYSGLEEFKVINEVTNRNQKLPTDLIEKDVFVNDGRGRLMTPLIVPRLLNKLEINVTIQNDQQLALAEVQDILMSLADKCPHLYKIEDTRGNSPKFVNIKRQEDLRALISSKYILIKSDESLGARMLIITSSGEHFIAFSGIGEKSSGKKIDDPAYLEDGTHLAGHLFYLELGYDFHGSPKPVGA